MPHGRQTYDIVGESSNGPARVASSLRPSRLQAVQPDTAELNTTGPRPGGPEIAAREHFRFARLGPKGRSQDVELLRALARAMVTGTGHLDAKKVPAGFTYLGQFVDHDLTLDLSPAPLGTDVDVADLVQGRSPTLDLDSVYGHGPRDRRDDRMYATDGASLVLGATAPISGVPGVSDAGTAVALNGYDLPRVGNGLTKSERQKALIPDLRNDENLIVAQTHVAVMRFHNAVVAQLASSTSSKALFETARDSVVRHYQWMLWHDFLPRIVDRAVLAETMARGRRFVEPGRRFIPPGHRFDRATMPVEFSVAAYRLGHSMIRAGYNWNRIFSAGGTGPVASLRLLFVFSGTSGTFNPGVDINDPDSGAFEKLPSNWGVDWRRLYEFTEAGRPDLAPPPGGGNVAKLIDTFMEDPLKELPLGSFDGKRPGPVDPDELNLAFRNLRRAAMLRLASGQQMAAFMGLTPLTPEQIVRGHGSGTDLSELPSEQLKELTGNTPLWFYVLREAELNGGVLTGVGARIVAETFHRAMEASRHSIVRDRRWRPTLGPDEQTFRMTDLLLRAFGPSAADLNPLGDAAPQATEPSDQAAAPPAQADSTSTPEPARV